MSDRYDGGAKALRQVKLTARRPLDPAAKPAADAAEAIGAAARFYDLAVVLQPGSGHEGFDNTKEVPFQTGGPVLFVPHISRGAFKAEAGSLRERSGAPGRSLDILMMGGYGHFPLRGWAASALARLSASKYATMSSIWLSVRRGFGMAWSGQTRRWLEAKS